MVVGMGTYTYLPRDRLSTLSNSISVELLFLWYLLFIFSYFFQGNLRLLVKSQLIHTYVAAPGEGIKKYPMFSFNRN